MNVFIFVILITPNICEGSRLKDKSRKGYNAWLGLGRQISGEHLDGDSHFVEI